MTAPAAPPATTEPGRLTKETYRGRIHPDWCPGCGDFSVLAALQTALFELGLQPHQVCVISGIGCSSNLPGYVNTYGMHTLHRRRRRRLRNWRQPFRPHDAPKRRPDLHRDGQPNLRPNHWPMLTHERQGDENQEYAARKR